MDYIPEPHISNLKNTPIISLELSNQDSKALTCDHSTIKIKDNPRTTPKHSRLKVITTLEYSGSLNKKEKKKKVRCNVLK